MDKKYIVVAEDDKYYANLFRIKLIKEGFEVLVIGDGMNALKVLRGRKPDLLLLDLVMPNRDGFEVLSEIKKDPELKDIRVVVFSNLGQEEDIKKAKDLGALGYYVKSDISLLEMVEKIKKYL